MNSDHDWYIHTAHLYIRFLRQESPNAAALLDRVFETDGARAALQASLALMQLKTNIKRTGKAMKLEHYENAMTDFPTTLPLFRRALRWLVIDYAMGIYHEERGIVEFTSPFNKTWGIEQRRISK